MLKPYGAAMLESVTGLRMEQDATETVEAKKPVLMKQIESGVNSMATNYGDQPATLTLRGRLLQLQGRNAEAIQILERSRRMLEQQKQPKDFELLYALARGYVLQGEIGQARQLLLEITSALDSFVPARLLLTQIFLQTNALSDADEQLVQLERLAGDDPEVIRLRLMYYILKNQPQQARELLPRLPESAVAQILTKASMALKLGDGAEAMRLLEAGRKLEPGNVDCVSSLAGMYLDNNQRDKAIAVAREARAANPNDERLKTIYIRVLQVAATMPAGVRR